MSVQLLYTLTNQQGPTGATGTIGPTIITSPPASSAGTFFSAIGPTANQNTLGYDIMYILYVNISANSGGSLVVGVGPTSTPTTQGIIVGTSLTGLLSIPVYLPKDYYVLINTSGSITVNVESQQVIPI